MVPAPQGGTVAALAPILAAGGDDLAGLLERTEAVLAEVAGSAGPALAPHASATVAAGGKRMRPLLVFLCGGDADGTVAAAVAVELVHTASLVHDDVIDAAPLRRGSPTVFARAGRETAAATGDHLFARAFSGLVATGDAEALRTLSGATSALARGELIQRADAWSPRVTRERYLLRCELKTASLFASACRLGALRERRPAADVEALSAFGREIGVAFQLLDDVLDVTGPPQRTGKHRGTDLLDGTVTLPLILARAEDEKLAALDLRSVDAADAAEEVCERIAATGALDEARATALARVAQAKETVAGLGLSEARRQALELAADGVVERYA